MMASEKNRKRAENLEESTEKTKKEHKETDKNSRKLSASDKKMAWGLILVFFLLLIGLGVSIFSLANRNDNNKFSLEGGMRDYKNNHLTGGMIIRHGTGGAYRTANNQVVVTGVVTAVDGQSFTIAGNGATNKITTNNSTEYKNATKASINDSVTVAGTVNNQVFTASKIIVHNRN